MNKLILGVILFPFLLSAQDWPQWRGPDASGHAPNGIYPVNWSSQENIIWKKTLPGRGHSSPVHDGENIWVTTALETPASEEEKKERLKENKGLPTVTVLSRLSLRALQINPASGKILKNIEIFDYIKTESVIESVQLAEERGECPDMEGTGRRNSHLLAIAPNANSSIICGTSPSIEPSKANAYTHRTRAGSHLVKDKYLEEELEKVGRNDTKAWTSIITNGGSVQHLKYLSDEVKSIFKTAIEIDQNEIISMAADRQQFLCQGQSLNVFFASGAKRAELHEVHYNAWKLGCKGMYYLRTETSNKAENVSTQVVRDALKDYETQAINQEECVACQG